MSLRRENLEELHMMLFQLFAVHLKLCVYIIFLEEIKIPILSYSILSIK